MRVTFTRVSEDAASFLQLTATITSPDQTRENSQWLSRKNLAGLTEINSSRAYEGLRKGMEFHANESVGIPAKFSWVKCARFSSSEYMDFRRCSDYFRTLPKISEDDPMISEQ